ncbi:MAG: hypothetical protein HQ564_08285 [Candidatus Saganbacteria bacterium]|nr:hypothetical protein [Candidatus Saganbacteria bacterium]
MRIPKNLVQPSAQRPWHKIESGLVKLGSWGICGMAWKWGGPGKPRGIDDFVAVMNKVPVATKKAFRQLWKHREICGNILDLLDKADTLELEEFEYQIAGLLRKVDLFVYLFPNNHVGIECGDPFVNQLLNIQSEEKAFSQASDVFFRNPDIAHLFYKMHDLDIFKLTTADLKKLREGADRPGLSISGRIVMTEQQMSGQTVSGIGGMLANRMGRKDFYFHKAQDKPIAKESLSDLPDC